MFKVVSKQAFFNAMEKGHKPAVPSMRLKYIQDCIALSILKEIKPNIVGEVGADQSRVLPEIRDSTSKCYAIDVYDRSIGGGTTKLPDLNHIYHYNCLIGQSQGVIPDNFFDCTFSISVVEHVQDLGAFYNDIIRISKPGGISFHLIDVYLDDYGINFQAPLVETSLRMLSDPRVRPIELPEIKNAKDLKFSCSHATNDDLTMFNWNKLAPKLSPQRSICQVVSILLGLRVL